VILGGSALEMKGIEEALQWLFNSVPERAP